MKQFLWMVALAAGVAFALAPSVSEAKRLGGGKPSGMQRSSVPDKPPQAPPASPAATPNAPAAPAATAAPVAGAAAAAATPKRSWMGPVAGLAAGLGLAALFSHLGLGEELASFMMLALLALVAVVVIRMVMRRFAAGGAMQRSTLAMAGAGAGAGAGAASLAPVAIGSALKPPLAVPGQATGATPPTLPAGFDVEGFERLARMLFIRMQAANDRADLNDLRNFTTPELFASLRLDLQDRGDARQTTDVARVDATLVDFAQEGESQIVSVRFTGTVREEEGAQAMPFDEVWHLVKPIDDSRSWAIAGIQQRVQ